MSKTTDIDSRYNIDNRKQTTSDTKISYDINTDEYTSTTYELSTDNITNLINQLSIKEINTLMLILDEYNSEKNDNNKDVIVNKLISTINTYGTTYKIHDIIKKVTTILNNNSGSVLSNHVDNYDEILENKRSIIDKNKSDNIINKNNNKTIDIENILVNNFSDTTTDKESEQLTKINNSITTVKNDNNNKTNKTLGNITNISTTKIAKIGRTTEE